MSRGIIIVILLLLSNKSFAIQSSDIAQQSFWFFDMSKFHSKSFLEISEKREEIRMPISKMKARIVKSQQDERVEPIYIPLKRDKNDLRQIARELATDGNSDNLFKYFEQNINFSRNQTSNSESQKIPLNREAFKYLDKDSLGDRFASLHYNLRINSQSLKEDKSKLNEFYDQIGMYFDDNEMRHIQKKIKHGLKLSVDDDLLPKFAKKMVKQFTIYRGPNCFHAALAFQDKNFTTSQNFNVKKEKGYHRAMINYDELHRALVSDFYEIDAAKTPLKYGDVIVFMDVPSKNPSSFNFKWIRHAATYLFDGYTFSKGSKSPNTPYSVKKLSEEWETWDRYTNLLAVKVFRKSAKSVKKTPAKDIDSWVY